MLFSQPRTLLIIIISISMTLWDLLHLQDLIAPLPGAQTSLLQILMKFSKRLVSIQQTQTVIMKSILILTQDQNH